MLPTAHICIAFLFSQSQDAPGVNEDFMSSVSEQKKGPYNLKHLCHEVASIASQNTS